jgi:hypothetical protein
MQRTARRMVWIAIARIQQSDTLVIVPDDAVRHLATLLSLAGTS